YEEWELPEIRAIPGRTRPSGDDSSSTRFFRKPGKRGQARLIAPYSKFSIFIDLFGPYHARRCFRPQTSGGVLNEPFGPFRSQALRRDPRVLDHRSVLRAPVGERVAPGLHGLAVEPHVPGYRGRPDQRGEDHHGQ